MIAHVGVEPHDLTFSPTAALDTCPQWSEVAYHFPSPHYSMPYPRRRNWTVAANTLGMSWHHFHIARLITAMSQEEPGGKQYYYYHDRIMVLRDTGPLIGDPRIYFITLARCQSFGRN